MAIVFWVIHRITAVVEVVVIGVVHRVVMWRHWSARTVTHWWWHWRAVAVVVEAEFCRTCVVSYAWRKHRHIEDFGAWTVPLESQRREVFESGEGIEFVAK